MGSLEGDVFLSPLIEESGSSERSLSPLPPKKPKIKKNAQGGDGEEKCKGREPEVERVEQEADLRKVKEWAAQQVDQLFMRTKSLIIKEFIDSRLSLFQKIENQFIQTFSHEIMNLLPRDLLFMISHRSSDLLGSKTIPTSPSLTKDPRWDAEIGKIARALRKSAQQIHHETDDPPHRKRRKTANSASSLEAESEEPKDDAAPAPTDKVTTPPPPSEEENNSDCSSESALSMRPSLTDTALREQAKRKLMGAGAESW